MGGLTMVRSGVIVQLMGFLFAVFFCCSCATLSFEVPTNKFLVPESDGPAFSSRFGAGYGSTSKITVQNYNSLRQVPPDTSYGKVTPNDSLNIHLEMAVYQPIDLFVSTIGTGVKVQALGDSVKEAKPGNRSLAFAFAGSGGTTTTNDSPVYTSGDSAVYSTSGKLDYDYREFMVLAGYRETENTLWYVNAGYMTISAHGSITQTDSTAGSANKTDTIYEIPKKSGRQLSLLAGCQLSTKHLYMILEPGFSQTSWSNADTMRRFALGVIFGFKF
jgi:hypothetical protein